MTIKTVNVLYLLCLLCERVQGQPQIFAPGYSTALVTTDLTVRIKNGGRKMYIKREGMGNI